LLLIQKLVHGHLKSRVFISIGAMIAPLGDFT
jgi:hypothetical protein